MYSSGRLSGDFGSGGWRFEPSPASHLNTAALGLSSAGPAARRDRLEARAVPLVGGGAAARRLGVARRGLGLRPTEIGTLIDPANALKWWQAVTERAGLGRGR